MLKMINSLFNCTDMWKGSGVCKPLLAWLVKKKKKNAINRGIFWIFVHFWLLAALLLSDCATGAVHVSREAESSHNKLYLEGHVGGKASGSKKKSFSVHPCAPSLFTLLSVTLQPVCLLVSCDQGFFQISSIMLVDKWKQWNCRL